jgi:hypothetical protein
MTCGMPSSLKWNLYQHISSCHAGVGNCVSNWDFPGTNSLHWDRWEKGATNRIENSHYIRTHLLRHFFSFNESNDRKPDNHQRVFVEEILKGLAKKAVSEIQPTQSRILFPFSPNRNYLRLICKYSVLEVSSIEIHMHFVSSIELSDTM